MYKRVHLYLVLRKQCLLHFYASFLKFISKYIPINLYDESNVLSVYRVLYLTHSDAQKNQKDTKKILKSPKKQRKRKSLNINEQRFQRNKVDMYNLIIPFYLFICIDQVNTQKALCETIFNFI